MIRAKMRLNAVNTSDCGHGVKFVKAQFIAQYDPSLPEDQAFQKATPNASAEFQVDNPAALEQLQPGKSYYFDIHEAPEK